jgi:hypothetical protein
LTPLIMLIILIKLFVRRSFRRFFSLIEKWSLMFLIINVCRLFLLFPRVTVISFMASEIDRFESSTSDAQMNWWSCYHSAGQFGFIIECPQWWWHRISFECHRYSCWTLFCPAWEDLLLNQRRYRKRFRTDRVDSVDFPRSYFFLLPWIYFYASLWWSQRSYLRNLVVNSHNTFLV